MPGKKYFCILGLFLAFSLILGIDAVQAELDFLEEDKLYNPREIGDFVEFFQEIDYEFHSAAGETVNTYILEGEEELDGEIVNRILLEATSFEQDFKFTVWVDQEGEVKRVRDEFSQEEIPVFLANTLLQAALSPFMTAEELGVEETIAAEYEGYELEHTATVEEKIGELEVQVHYFEVESEDDDAFAGTATYRIADFEDFLMLIGFDIPDYRVEDFEYLEFEVTSIILN